MRPEVKRTTTLRTTNFRKIHFGQKYQKQNILEIIEEYDGVGLKNFQPMQQKLENAFLAKLSNFMKIL